MHCSSNLCLNQIDKEDTLKGTLAILDDLPINTGDLYVRVFQAAQKDYPGPLLPLLMRTVITLVEPLSLVALAGLMDEDVAHIMQAYNALSALLLNEGEKVRLLHKSVADFLLDQNNRSNPFFVDLVATHRQLAVWCLDRILADGVLRPNICNLDPCLTNSSQNVSARIAENIPEHIQYSCRFWITHAIYLLDPSSFRLDTDLAGLVSHLYARKLLVWLEVLALLDSLGVVVHGTLNLKEWWGKQANWPAAEEVFEANTCKEVPVLVEAVNDVQETKKRGLWGWMKKKSRDKPAMTRHQKLSMGKGKNKVVCDSGTGNDRLRIVGNVMEPDSNQSSSSQDLMNVVVGAPGEKFAQKHEIITSLIVDACRFVMEFHVPLFLRTPHLYISALPLTPFETVLYQTYHSSKSCQSEESFIVKEFHRMPTKSFPSALRGTDPSWTNCLLTLEGHSSQVTSVAISSNEKSIVTGSEDKTAKV